MDVQDGHPAHAAHLECVLRESQPGGDALPHQAAGGDRGRFRGVPELFERRHARDAQHQSFVGALARDRVHGTARVGVANIQRATSKFRGDSHTEAPADGERFVALYDDIGDLLEYEEENPGLAIERRWVHDHATHEWIDAETAYFVVSDTLRTPMMSGMAAFADRASAEEMLEKHAGEIVEFENLEWIKD